MFFKPQCLEPLYFRYSFPALRIFSLELTVYHNMLPKVCNNNQHIITQIFLTISPRDTASVNTFFILKSITRGNICWSIKNISTLTSRNSYFFHFVLPLQNSNPGALIWWEGVSMLWSVYILIGLHSLFLHLSMPLIYII